MQQTNNYKLNLIETSDTFSPDPLNENMEKVESALDAARSETTAEAAARAAADAALDQRLAVFEGRHRASGTYTPQRDSILTFDLGFYPLMVWIQGLGSSAVSGVITRDIYYSQGYITPTGFCIGYAPDSGGTINRPDTKFVYFAFD